MALTNVTNFENDIPVKIITNVDPFNFINLYKMEPRNLL